MELEDLENIEYAESFDTYSDNQADDLSVYSIALGVAGAAAVATAYFGIEYLQAGSHLGKVENKRTSLYNQERAWRNARWALNDGKYDKATSFVKDCSITDPEAFSKYVESGDIESALSYAQEGEETATKLIIAMRPEIDKSINSVADAKSNLYFSGGTAAVAGSIYVYGKINEAKEKDNERKE